MTEDNSSPAEDTDGTPRSGKGLPASYMARFHAVIALALLALFAIADSWHSLSDISLAVHFSVLSGLGVGALLTTGVHEWFHYLGALMAGGRFRRPRQRGLFVFDWDFAANSTAQFLVMSVAGTVGSLLAVYFLASSVPPDNAGRLALLGASWGSLVFSAWIEWPVLYRVLRGAEPLAALGRITGGTVTAGAAAGLVTVAVVARVLAA